MNHTYIQARHILLGLTVVPVVAFAVYISWLVVPEVVRIVVPEVIRTVRSVVN